ncbi:hypothetical protein SGCOL_004411 [Colletotrichum sp. CLE4]
MCISEKYICECKWPRDTVRYCQNFVDTGVVCPGTSQMILLHGTEERKHPSGVYRCSNISCDLWDMVMCRGIRLRGQRIDRDFGLQLGRWTAEKATNALTNKAIPAHSGGEGHASTIVIADDSNQASDNDEGLEVPQPIEPVAAAEPEPQPDTATPEGVQHVDDHMPANIPEPEADEATDDDLDNLFGGPSAPPSPDMSLVKNHPTIILPTGGNLPSPALSQPTPEKPVIEGDSPSPAANTTVKQSTPLILPAQAPLLQQQKQLQPVPQISQKLAPRNTAQNTTAMVMGNNTSSPNGNPAVPPAVPQTATPPMEGAQVRPMRPTLSGANQATLNALRAHAPRPFHGVFPSREVLVQARILAMASSSTPGAQEQASSRPRPPMDMSKFGGHKPVPGSQQTGNNGFVNGQGKTVKGPRNSGPNIQQQRAMSPAVRMPPQTGYTAIPQVSQRPIPTYTAQNTMTMGNNMTSPMSHQQRMVSQAPGMPTQNAQNAHMAGPTGFGVSRMPGAPAPGFQNPNPAARRVGNNMPNGAWQGMSIQEMTDQDIWLQNMLSQTTTSSNWQSMSSQTTTYQNMAPHSIAPQNVSLQGMPSMATTPQNGYMASPRVPQNGYTTSPMVPQLAPAGLSNFGLNPQMRYQGMPNQGMLPQGMSPRGMSNQGIPPQNGYMSSPVAPQMKMAPIAGPNGMRAQQGLGNLANMAAMAPSLHAGLDFQTMASPSVGIPAGTPYPQTPPQPIFNDQMFVQQNPRPQTPQMASGMPGMPPMQRIVGPAPGQKRSHSVISTGCVDPRMLSQPPSAPSGMPDTSPANTPQQPGVEDRQAKCRAM